ncbi:unnamed protein product [Somion occarium]|uniref:BRCT domain-containing protein n=1 Tax=Somion occarium TaxID=3059160 RepID=A0ABP1E8Q3_9APHY
MAGPRRNKSHKVPGVKLRPALPKSKRKDSGFEDSPSYYDQDDDIQNSSDLDASYAGDVCPRPFRSVVLCATGIADKLTLFKQALELGAQSFSDLTDRVTHLIAEEHGSAKYKCALETGIPIMHPSWIFESHKVWLRGDDVDFQESQRIHRLPIFSNVTLAVTGFEDIPKRTEIHRLVVQHGGTYVKNIERPVRVTHLLCFNSHRSASGSDAVSDDPPSSSIQTAQAEEELAALRETSVKARYAEKFNARKEASIQVIWEDWFWDCLACGGRWDEELYKVGVVTKEEAKKRSEERARIRESQAASMTQANQDIPISASATTSIHPLAGEPVAAPHNGTFDDPEHEEEEPASIKRIPGAKLALWGSLLKPRGFVVDEGKLVRSPSKSQTQRRTEDGEDSPTKGKVEGMKSVVEMVSVSGDGGKIVSSTIRGSQLQQVHPLKRVLTNGGSIHAQSNVQIPSAGDEAHRNLEAPPSSSYATPQMQQPQPEAGPSNHSASPSKPNSVPKPAGIFSNTTFRLLGEARSVSVRSAVEGAGGNILSVREEEDGHGDVDENIDFVLVRLVSGSTLYHTTSLTISPSKFRTECWLERCLFEERICPGEEHMSFRPLENREPIEGIELVNLSYSGLDQSEACWLRRLARALGLTIAPNFSRRSTHLLCPSRSGAKFEKAQEWGIPVVGMEWLEEMIHSGRVPGFHIGDDSGYRQGGFASKGKGKANGKGKERATDMMMDITNNEPAASVPRPKSPVAIPMEVDAAPARGTADESFGPPNHLLSPPQSSPSPLSPQHPPSPQATPPPSSPPIGEPHSSSPIPATPPRANRHSQSHLPQPTRTQLELQHDREHTRIPSSETPSPMKPPSPIRLRNDLDRETTTMLNDKLTTLLGKRQVPDNEGDSGRLTTPELEPMRAKRARPPSRSKLAMDSSRINVIPSSPGQGDISVALTSPMKSTAIPAIVGEASADVTVDYEEPSQSGERNKLLRLLQNQNKEVWEVPDNDDDDASVIVVEGPVPKKARPARRGGSGSSRGSKARPAAKRRSTRLSGF